MLMTFDEFNDIKILFADLDGTVVKTKSGKKFPVDSDDWVFKNGFLKAIKNYRPTMFHIVSNQGGIEKHTTDENGWNKKVTRILREIGCCLGYDCGLSYDYCRSNNSKDRKRKPNTGMFEDFFDKHNLIKDTKQYCLMIGDASGEQGDFSDTDKKSAENFDIEYMDIDDFIRKYSK